MRRIGLVTCAIASTFLVAACGSTSSGGSTSPQASASNPAFDKPAALAAAKQALLTRADFPSGWTTSPSDDSADSKKIDAKLATCMHVSPGLFGGSDANEAEADSPDFNSPRHGPASVSESIDIGTTSVIDTEFAGVESPRLPGCFDSIFGPYLKSQFAHDPSTRDAIIGAPKTTPLAVPKLGDDATGIRITIPFKVHGVSATVYLDVLFVRVGNTGAELTFSDVLSAFDSATEQRLAETAVKKITAANVSA